MPSLLEVQPHGCLVLVRSHPSLMPSLLEVQPHGCLVLVRSRPSLMPLLVEVTSWMFCVGKKPPFTHAITAWGTTSRMFGVGKKLLFQKLVKGNSIIQFCSNKFVLPVKGHHWGPRSSIAMAVVFNGKCLDSLAPLHYMFIRKVASVESYMTPERLPATALHTPPNQNLLQDYGMEWEVRWRDCHAWTGVGHWRKISWF